MKVVNIYFNNLRTVAIAILLFCCNSLISSGQKHSVQNVSFDIKDNGIAIIYYDLEGRGKNRRYNVELFLRQEANRLFSFQPVAVVGDIGKGRFEGQQRMIIWSIDHETPENFKPDPFISDYYFMVNARRKSSAGWWIFTVLAGGAAYYLLN